MRLRLEFNYTGRSAFSSKEMNEAFKEANEAVVEFWHHNFIPLHFTDAAMDRYSYQHRSGQDEPEFIPKNFAGKVSQLLGQSRFRMVKNPKYYWRKKRSGHGTTPLVYSGQSRNATRDILIRAASKQAVGTFPSLSRYFYQYRTDVPGKPIDKADELIRLLQEEINQMAPIHEKAMQAHLDAVAAAQRETVVYAA